jgi:hypothetical protein
VIKLRKLTEQVSPKTDKLSLPLIKFTMFIKDK